MRCPIDGDECEGACGPKGTHMCAKRCERGRLFCITILERNKGRKTVAVADGPVEGYEPRGRRGEDQHGVAWWAKKYKCYCDPCVEAKRKYSTEDQAMRREQKKINRGGARINRTQVIDQATGLPVGIRHGTKQAWSKYKCKCDECLTKKKVYNKEYSKLRRQKAKVQVEVASGQEASR